jgi:dihydrofolate reductase
MTVSLIVAMTDDRVIGKNNQLPWHLSDYLKRFMKITMGHPIIMGRKTYESIGKPLPGRQNVVVTRDKNFRADGITVAHGVCEALAACEQNTDEKFIIGGAGLFEAAWPLINRLYLTMIHHPFDGDVRFPPFDLERDFRITEKTDHENPDPRFSYSFITAERRA